MPEHAPGCVATDQDNRAIDVTPTAKQLACPHPVTQCTTFSDGITICHHCFGVVSIAPRAQAA